MGRAEQRIQTWQTTPEHVEQSTDDIWRAVGSAVRAACREAGARPDAIVGIGFDATCSLVALDASDRPVSVSRRRRRRAQRHRLDGSPRRRRRGRDQRDRAPRARLRRRRDLARDADAETALAEARTSAHVAAHRALVRSADYLTWRATGSDDRSLCSTVCKWTYLGHERRWDPTYFDAIGLGDLTADSFRKIGSRVRVPGERLGVLTERRRGRLRSRARHRRGDVDDRRARGRARHARRLGRTRRRSRDAWPIIAGTSACHLATAPAGTSVPGVWGPYYEALLPNEWLLEAGISASGAFLDHVLRSHPAYDGAHAHVRRARDSA